MKVKYANYCIRVEGGDECIENVNQPTHIPPPTSIIKIKGKRYMIITHHYDFDNSEVNVYMELLE